MRLTIMNDGIPLSAVLEKPDRERCPAVIVLHGFTGTKDRPHTLAACEAMRSAGFATVRFDLYGHGESGGAFGDHTLYKWISDTMTVIDCVRKMDFVTGIFLSGHSQGGLTAALTAGMENDRILGLILRAPAFMIPRCAREGEMLGVRFDPRHVPDEFGVIKGLTLKGNYIRVAQTLDVGDAIDRFDGPVLILHGDRDDVVPLGDSADAAKRYQRCRLEVLPGETHHFDTQTERMKDIIREWLLPLNGTQA